jgi:hypothetical protein
MLACLLLFALVAVLLAGLSWQRRTTGRVRYGSCDQHFPLRRVRYWHAVQGCPRCCESRGERCTRGVEIEQGQRGGASKPAGASFGRPRTWAPIHGRWFCYIQEDHRQAAKVAESQIRDLRYAHKDTVAEAAAYRKLSEGQKSAIQTLKNHVKRSQISGDNAFIELCCTQAALTAQRERVFSLAKVLTSCTTVSAALSIPTSARELSTALDKVPNHDSLTGGSCVQELQSSQDAGLLLEHQLQQSSKQLEELQAAVQAAERSLAKAVQERDELAFGLKEVQQQQQQQQKEYTTQLHVLRQVRQPPLALHTGGRPGSARPSSVDIN